MVFICCLYQQKKGSNKENKESCRAGTREWIWILERRVQSVGWGAQETEVCGDDKRDAA